MINTREELMDMLIDHVMRDAVKTKITGQHPLLDIKAAGRCLLSNEWWECVDYAIWYGEKRGIPRQHILDEITKIIRGKGVGYAGGEFYLGNFFRIGLAFEESPIKNIKYYTYKHIDFLIQAEKLGQIHGPDGLLERLADIVNYSALAHAVCQVGK